MISSERFKEVPLIRHDMPVILYRKCQRKQRGRERNGGRRRGRERGREEREGGRGRKGGESEGLCGKIRKHTGNSGESCRLEAYGWEVDLEGFDQASFVIPHE